MYDLSYVGINAKAIEPCLRIWTIELEVEAYCGREFPLLAVKLFVRLVDKRILAKFRRQTSGTTANSSFVYSKAT